MCHLIYIRDIFRSKIYSHFNLAAGEISLFTPLLEEVWVSWVDLPVVDPVVFGSSSRRLTTQV